MDSAILLFEEELVTEDVSERLPVYAMYVCLTEKRDLCNMLLLGAVNDVVTLASSVMEFAPGVWWNLQLDSGNGFGVVYPVSAFASADSDARAFPPISFENVERSQYQDDWNASYYAEFNGLWKSNAFRRLLEEGLPKNANVVKIWKVGQNMESGSKYGKLMTVEMWSSRCLGWWKWVPVTSKMCFFGDACFYSNSCECEYRCGCKE